MDLKFIGLSIFVMIFSEDYLPGHQLEQRHDRCDGCLMVRPDQGVQGGHQVMVLVMPQQAGHRVQALEVTGEAGALVRGQVLPPEAGVSQEPGGELGTQQPGEVTSCLRGADNASRLLQTVPDTEYNCTYVWVLKECLPLEHGGELWPG